MQRILIETHASKAYSIYADGSDFLSIDRGYVWTNQATIRK